MSTPLSEKWQIQYHFCCLIDDFYSEFRKKKEKKPELLHSLHLLLGVQTLLHVYRIGWSRGYSIRPILILCKNAQMYFFEYLNQWNNMGLPLRTNEMLIFIYDRVLEKQDYSIAPIQNVESESALDDLALILNHLPDIESKTTVRTFEKIIQNETVHGEK